MQSGCSILSSPMSLPQLYCMRASLPACPSTSRWVLSEPCRLSRQCRSHGTKHLVPGTFPILLLLTQKQVETCTSAFSSASPQNDLDPLGLLLQGKYCEVFPMADPSGHGPRIYHLKCNVTFGLGDWKCFHVRCSVR